MPFVFLRQIRRMLKIPRLSTHSDCSDQVEWQLFRICCIPPRLGPDEAIEPRDVFELGVGVE